MAVTTDILKTYKGPRQVFARLLSTGPREDRLVALAMGSCVVMFIAQLPRLSRVAHMTDQDLNMLMGGSLLAIVFVLPLILYALAFVFHLLAHAFGGKGQGFQSRVALFWAMMAASPLILLNGLIAGFIGNGPALSFVGGLWCAAVLWFLLTGLHEAYWRRQR